MISTNIPKLTLIGAGPGDPELLTVKGLKALKQANVVLYDHLANEELLDYCHPLCEKIYVGKKGHCKSISQDSINFLIVEKAYEKGNVVRLKGGDPFVFGRGSEEILFARRRGVITQYIPGISSVNAVGLADIPLTERGKSDGFWVITGHKSDGSLSSDVRLAAQSNSTVVILMGMSKLQEIVSIFQEEGKTDVAAAIIQNASAHDQKVLVSKIGNIVESNRKSRLTNPAVIVIGEVVNSIKCNSIPSSLLYQLVS